MDFCYGILRIFNFKQGFEKLIWLIHVQNGYFTKSKVWKEPVDRRKF